MKRTSEFKNKFNVKLLDMNLWEMNRNFERNGKIAHFKLRVFMNVIALIWQFLVFTKTAQNIFKNKSRLNFPVLKSLQTAHSHQIKYLLSKRASHWKNTSKGNCSLTYSSLILLKYSSLLWCIQVAIFTAILLFFWVTTD